MNNQLYYFSRNIVIAMIFFTGSLCSQSYPGVNVFHKVCTDCPSNTMDVWSSANPQIFNYGQIQEYATVNISSDFGPRYLGQTWNYHRGIDFGFPGDVDAGNAILSQTPGTGTITNIQEDTHGDYIRVGNWVMFIFSQTI